MFCAFKNVLLAEHF